MGHSDRVEIDAVYRIQQTKRPHQMDAIHHIAYTTACSCKHVPPTVQLEWVPDIGKRIDPHATVLGQ
jgi:hypothetical protein